MESSRACRKGHRQQTGINGSISIRGDAVVGKRRLLTYGQLDIVQESEKNQRGININVSRQESMAASAASASAAVASEVIAASWK